jgi:hypothetical protein
VPKVTTPTPTTRKSRKKKKSTRAKPKKTGTAKDRLHAITKIAKRQFRVSPSAVNYEDDFSNLIFNKKTLPKCGLMKDSNLQKPILHYASFRGNIRPQSTWETMYHLSVFTALALDYNTFKDYVVGCENYTPLTSQQMNTMALVHQSMEILFLESLVHDSKESLQPLSWDDFRDHVNYTRSAYATTLLSIMSTKKPFVKAFKELYGHIDGYKTFFYHSKADRAVVLANDEEIAKAAPRRHSTRRKPTLSIVNPTPVTPERTTRQGAKRKVDKLSDCSTDDYDHDDTALERPFDVTQTVKKLVPRKICRKQPKP